MPNTKYIVDTIGKKATAVHDKYFGPNGIVTQGWKKWEKSGKKNRCEIEKKCDHTNDNECEDRNCCPFKRRVFNITQKEIDETKGTIFIHADNALINLCENIRVTSKGHTYAGTVFAIFGNNNRVHFQSHNMIGDNTIPMAIVMGRPDQLSSVAQISGNGRVTGFYYASVCVMNMNLPSVQSMIFTENIATELHHDFLLTTIYFIECLRYAVRNVTIEDNTSKVLQTSIIVAPIMAKDSYGIVQGSRITRTTCANGSAWGYMNMNLGGGLPLISMDGLYVSGVIASEAATGVAILTAKEITGASCQGARIEAADIETTTVNTNATGFMFSGLTDGSIAAVARNVTATITDISQPFVASALFAPDVGLRLAVKAEFITTTVA
ncbi:MAG: hypothetical protein Hyperionvirus2_75 [Hyperionvirus sp.]|uniref:Uncharacterized protein n=1 Tax=Hyperionvirus sp. TaxID=2487770 RepID=A0A3G5A647_9VIRU|nr:MAG: hypothetical protein Hyperionvirus2_75 [Hyperionvirus sp.]